MKIHLMSHLSFCRTASCHLHPFLYWIWRRKWQLNSSVLARRIPRTEKPGGLWSVGSHRVRHNRVWHNWSDLASTILNLPGGSWYGNYGIIDVVNMLIYSSRILSMLPLIFLCVCVLSRVWIFVTPSSSFVHGILQARILEWVAIYSPRGSSWPRGRTHISWAGRQILYLWTTWETHPWYL